jgi:hypothetical protein
VSLNIVYLTLPDELPQKTIQLTGHPDTFCILFEDAQTMHPLIQRYTVPFLFVATPALAVHLTTIQLYKKAAFVAELGSIAARQEALIPKQEALNAAYNAVIQDLSAEVCHLRPTKMTTEPSSTG